MYREFSLRFMCSMYSCWGKENICNDASSIRFSVGFQLVTHTKARCKYSSHLDAMLHRPPLHRPRALFWILGWRIHTASGGTPSTRMARKTKDLAEAYPAACAEAKCKAVAPFVGALARAVDAGAELTFVRLNGNSKELFNGRVDGRAAVAIASALTGTATVEEVDLSYNRIDDAGAEAIAAMLARSPAVRRLDLRGNDIGPEGAAHIARALAATGGSGGSGGSETNDDAASASSSSSCRLESLRMDHNPLGDDGLIAVASSLRTNTSLRELDVGDCDAGIRGVTALCVAVFEDNTTLKSLGMENPSRLFTHQCEHVFHAARMLASSVIANLKIGKWRVDAGGIETLAAYGVAASRHLECLNLRCNAVCEVGASAVARIVREGERLRYLNLERNPLGDRGAEIIARALPHSCALEEIDLRCAGIADVGLCALADGIVATTPSRRPRVVRLWGNAFGEGALVTWRRALRESEEVGCPIATDFVITRVDGEGPGIARLDVPDDVAVKAWDTVY